MGFFVFLVLEQFSVYSRSYDVVLCDTQISDIYNYIDQYSAVHRD